MKTVLPTLIACMLLVACEERVARDFFAADGIVIGEAEWRSGDLVWIPVTFETDGMHSAQWLQHVDAEVIGTGIVLTAEVGKPPNAKPSEYEGGVFLKDPVPGGYRVLYRDPDGTEHALGAVEIPAKP